MSLHAVAVSLHAVTHITVGVIVQIEFTIAIALLGESENKLKIKLLGITCPHMRIYCIFVKCEYSFESGQQSTHYRSQISRW